MEQFIEERMVPWGTSAKSEVKIPGFFFKSLANGKEGGPQAGMARKPEGYVTGAHFHDAAQFQLLLEGSAKFPKHQLAPISVHYSDANTPYGPFVVGPGNLTAALRQHRAEQIDMSDREGRKRRNPYGRELYGQSEQVPWEQLTGEFAGISRKILIGKEGEKLPEASIWKYPPMTVIQRTPAPFGRFRVFLEGEALGAERPLRPYSMLFERGDSWPAVLSAGEAGATCLVMTFDQE